MIYLLISLSCFAAELPGEEIFVAKPIEKEVRKSSPQAAQTLGVPPKYKKESGGNLPNEYLVRGARQSTASVLVTPPAGSVEVFKGIRVGETILVSIHHSVIAFPDEKSPVVGSVESGSHRGLKFVGESYLEPNSKRIFIDIKRLVLGEKIYDLSGVGLSSSGQPGLKGQYHSREAEYFTGDFVSSFVAGYFDGLVPRTTNAFGQVQDDASVDTAVKKGLASGALSTANRFREKLKKVPEFSEIRGPFEIQILILEQARIGKLR